ncbi:MAG: hypothetical protein H0X24_00905 [Ktedonobacterales bacterium]|nr:hypothetical protein [Ktedonobacterales bacterium]
MDMSAPHTKIALLVLRIRQVIASSQGQLLQLEAYLKTQGQSPQGDSDYGNLANALWTMETTLATYEQGTLMTRAAGNPDRADHPIQAELDMVFALNAPLDLLIAAEQVVFARLAAGGQAQSAGQ